VIGYCCEQHLRGSRKIENDDEKTERASKGDASTIQSQKNNHPPSSGGSFVWRWIVSTTTVARTLISLNFSPLALPTTDKAARIPVANFMVMMVGGLYGDRMEYKRSADGNCQRRRKEKKVSPGQGFWTEGSSRDGSIRYEKPEFSWKYEGTIAIVPFSISCRPFIVISRL
jgi:hypothetical protein